MGAVCAFRAETGACVTGSGMHHGKIRQKREDGGGKRGPWVACRCLLKKLFELRTCREGCSGQAQKGQKEGLQGKAVP